ncbi:MAG: glycerate kinase [Victivallaceae bacterium]|nr:glycerate kinase [Victivallaceae bacterium]
MKFVIAPDSYKGCLRSIEICEYLATGIRQVIPDAEIEKLPLADGGEGTVEAIVFSTGGEFRKLKVQGPLEGQVEAVYGIAGNSGVAVMEMAAASGIELLSREQLNPLKTTTYGTGELLREIIKNGAREIIIGIGGSATVDGGSGMAQALGYRFLDKNGIELKIPLGGGDLHRIAAIDAGNVLPELRECRIRIASDVTNPLTGPNGAAPVFGPQKGATAAMVAELDENLDHYAAEIIAAGFAKDCEQPGDGAAGGLGFGLRALGGAQPVSGAELIMEIAGLKSKLIGADVLITGEGCTDFQTAHGKLCAVVAQAAADAKVPAVLVSGALTGDLRGLSDLFTAMFSTAVRPCSLKDAIAQTPVNLVRLGRNIAGLMHLGSC